MPFSRLLSVYTPMFALVLGGFLELSIHQAPFTFRFRKFLVLSLLGCALLLSVLVTLGPLQPKPVLEWNPTLRNSGYATLANALKPIVQPTDCISPEALGVMSFLLPQVYMHDFIGLTDGHIAKDGPVYQRTFGKSDYAYTVLNIHPTIIVTHSSLWHLRQMEHYTTGQFSSRYTIFELRSLNLTLSIENSSVPRFMSVLGRFEPVKVSLQET